MMIGLDTNAVPELMRSHPDTNVVDWVVGQATNTLHLIHCQ